VRAIAEQQGYLSPEKAKALEDQIARTQADLERIRVADPDWRAEVDEAIEAFNRSDIAGAKAAFARIDALIAERRAKLIAQERELRQEEARSKHAQATLFYPFEASRSEPLLTQAAELAETNIWYWIECGRARLAIGSLARAAAAFQTARDLAEASGSDRDLGVALNSLGDVRRAQGDLAGALDAYAADLAIADKLAAADPGNAEWQRDLSVSWERIGDVRRAHGDLAGALAAHNERHAIAEKLAAADPGNAGWQRDLSVSWERLAGIHERQGDRAEAIAAWREALTISEALAARFPDSVDLQTTPVVHFAGLARLADVTTAEGRAAARGHLERALALLQPLAAAGKLDAQRAGWVDWIEGELAELEP